MLPIAIITTLAIPFPFIAHLISMGGRVTRRVDSDTSVSFVLDASIPGVPSILNSLYKSIFLCAAAFCGLIMNTLIVRALWKLRHKNKAYDTHGSSNKDSEAKLFILAIILFALLVGEMVVQVNFCQKQKYFSAEYPHPFAAYVNASR